MGDTAAVVAVSKCVCVCVFIRFERNGGENVSSIYSVRSLCTVYEVFCWYEVTFADVSVHVTVFASLDIASCYRMTYCDAACSHNKLLFEEPQNMFMVFSCDIIIWEDSGELCRLGSRASTYSVDLSSSLCL